MNFVQRARTPGVEEFQRRFVALDQPVVITGALEASAAYSRWTDEYLRATIGEQIVPIEFAGSDEPGGEKQLLRTESMRFAEFLDRSRRSDPASSEVMYLAQGDLDQLPALTADLPAPAYCGRQGLRRKLWIGPAGTLSPLHFDHVQNLFCQIRGRKKVTLVPASQFDECYPGAFFAPVPHMSRLGDIRFADRARFPRFRPETCIELTLEPGEMLFVPCHWWHQVESIEPSVSVSFWWRVPLRSWFTRPSALVVTNFVVSAILDRLPRRAPEP